MAKTLFVDRITQGTPVEEIFALVEVRPGQARNGPFWQFKVQDKTGRMEARLWSPASLEHEDIPQGVLALVRGQGVTYKDQTQIQVERLTLLDPGDVSDSMHLFLPSSGRDPAIMLEELECLCRDNLTHKAWRHFTARLLKDADIRERLLVAQGGKGIHHAYAGGLVEHTLAVCRICLALSALYPDLDREILLTAAVCHDLGKAWEMSQGVSVDYTDSGRLLGHIQITLELIRPLLDGRKDLDPGLALHLRHIILSHHGEYEFGSPKRPKTMEAMVLHYADNLDAKLNQMGIACNGLSTGEWTEFQRSLGRFLYQPPRTPRPREEDGNQEKQSQCSLPLKA